MLLQREERISSNMEAIEKISHSMGQLDSIKVYGANALAFVSTFSSIDAGMKITLLGVSIIYTSIKTWALVQDRIEKRKKGK